MKLLWLLKIIVIVKTGKLGTVFPVRQTIGLHENARILCRSRSNAAWEYIRRFKKSMKVERGNLLTVKGDLMPTAMGSFWCHGTLENGKEFVSKAKVYRGVSTNYLTPANQEVKVGQSVVFNCKVPHIKFHKKIHWIFNFGPIDGYAIAYGPRSSSLKIESVRAIHSGKYTCAGSYLINANKRSEFTSSARLIVIDNSRIYPQKMEVEMLQPVKFTCLSEHYTTWSLNGKQLPFDVKVWKNNTLYINQVKDYHFGKYRCSGQTDEVNKWTGVKGKFAADVWLIIKGSYCPPVDLEHGHIKLEGRGIGHHAIFICLNEYQPISGDMFRVCQHNRQWSGEQPVCAKKCIKPKLKNGYTEIIEEGEQDNKFAHDALAKFSCNPGFDLLGSRLSFCSRQGKWSGSHKCFLAKNTASLIWEDFIQLLMPIFLYLILYYL